jgi:drug/metabolite transporter (DMT)-like permease
VVIKVENINIWVLLSVSLVITLAYGMFRNYFSKNTVKTVSDFYIFNFASSLLSAAALLALSGGFKMPSAYTFFLGAAFGIATALAAIFNLQAFKIGPMSYTTVILTTSMIIPALSGQLFWEEKVGSFQYVGAHCVKSDIVYTLFEDMVYNSGMKIDFERRAKPD